jgi:hypothetical protein
MSNSRAKKKNRNRNRNKLVNKFKENLQKEGFLQDKKLVLNPPGQEKMSDVLMEFIQPYEDYATNDEAFGKLIALAIVAWNAANLPPTERNEMIGKILTVALPEAKEDARAIIREMIKRKEKKFAENRRMILRYEVQLTPRGRHLSVVSTMERRADIGEP